MSSLGNKEVMAKNIKYYMFLENKTRNDICNDLNFKYTTFVDWETGKTYPRIDKIEMLANYFGIQKSDLIEEKKEATPSTNGLPTLTLKDQRDIARDLQKILLNLESDAGLAFYEGEPMSEESKEVLRISLENSMRLAKQLAKKKYTPKKYRK